MVRAVRDMKILGVMGSPRLDGNTSRMLAAFHEQIGNEHLLELVNLTSLDINGCLGCKHCQRNTLGECLQNDDTSTVLARIRNADAVIYASPLYAWSFSAQMKALIDRHYCMVSGAGPPFSQSLMLNKPIALAVTCEGPVENNADLIQVLFDRFTTYSGSICVGKYILPFCTTPNDIADRAATLAIQMVKDFASLPVK